MQSDFVNWAKTIDWNSICDISQSLDDLNDSQYRFLKGRFIEILVEKYSNGVLKFVGEKHKDFDCTQYNCSIELKSVVSGSFYTKKGELRKNFSVRLNNSMGTNNIKLNKDSVCDWLIIIKRDGVVLTTRETVISCAKSHGDGFILYLQPENVIEISGRLELRNKYNLQLRQKIDLLLNSLIDKIFKNV